MGGPRGARTNGRGARNVRTQDDGKRRPQKERQAEQHTTGTERTTTAELDHDRAISASGNDK
eukprot:15296757-Alexandrium_andersonii.AAC.1